MPCDLLKDGEGATEGLYGDALAIRRTASDIALKRFRARFNLACRWNGSRFQARFRFGCSCQGQNLRTVLS
jgi:hypothetical protein